MAKTVWHWYRKWMASERSCFLLTISVCKYKGSILPWVVTLKEVNIKPKINQTSKIPFSYWMLFLLVSTGDAEKIRQLEETIRGLTKDLHNMQTTIHGINQRLYVNIVFYPSCTCFVSWSAVTHLLSGNIHFPVLLWYHHAVPWVLKSTLYIISCLL